MVAIKITSVLALTLSTATPVISAAIEAIEARGYAPDRIRCYTKLDSKSLPAKQIKTSWRTEFTPCTTTVTVSSKSTSTPLGVTSTSTVLTTTTITAPTNLLTQTATITNTETDSVTETDTATSTETSTLSTSAVTTAGTSSGFLPVQTTLPGSTCDSSCGTNPNQKRSGEVNASLEGRSLNPAKNPFQGGGYGTKYPQSVSCCRWTQKPLCSKKTTTIVSVIAAPTPTTTTTITSTVSTTFVPSATTTISTTVISTISTTATLTTTSTTTTTQTTVTATSTIYAACATNNIVDLYNNQGAINFNEGTGPTANVISVAATSAYDCCVANINYSAAYSQFFVWYPAGSTCLISTGASCSSGSTSKSFSPNSGTVTYVFGNGNCGQFVPSI